MFRRSFLGIALAALGGLAFGRKAFAAPAPGLQIPPQMERQLVKELDDPDGYRTVVVRITRKEGRDVWSRCYI